MGVALRVPDLSFADANLGMVTRCAVSAPSINISNFVVRISAESGTTIKYTINGSTPSASVGTTYSEPFTPSANCTIKAVAIKDGETSAVSSVEYFVRGSLPAPSISENGNVITMSAANGMSIYYTTDGSEPTTSSNKYTTPFTLNVSATIKAKAFNASGNYSPTAEFGYSYGDTIAFRSAAVKNALLAAGIGSDGEITKTQAAAVTSIPTFNGNTEITSFDEFRFFTGIRQLPKDLFNGCTELTSVIVPSGVNSIAVTSQQLGVFSGCTKLKKIKFDGAMSSLNHHTFSGCTSLDELTLPSGLSTIGYMCFNGCSSLNIDIPLSVTKIEAQAFSGCTSLTKANCQNVTDFAPNSQSFTGTFAGCTSLTDVVLNDNVGAIYLSMFNECTSLVNINIPSKASVIYGEAFNVCTNLVLNTIPANVVSINDGAFKNCKSLTNLTIEEGVSAIGGIAFYRCDNLVIDTLPSTITSIGVQAFQYTKVNKVKLLATTPPSVDTNSFPGEIYVPDAVYDTYKVTGNWSSYYSKGKLKKISEW